MADRLSWALGRVSGTRDLRAALREAKFQTIALSRAQEGAAAKAAAQAKRAFAKMTLKGVARRIGYAAIKTELRQELRAINRRARDGRRLLAAETRRLTWIDWLQEQASSGRQDALKALRAARRRTTDQTTTLSAHGLAPQPPPVPDSEAEVTKQGTVIERVGDYEIRDNGESLHIATAAGDDVIVALLHRAMEGYGNSLNAHGSEGFQLRIARVAGTHHLGVSFEDPALEQARRDAQAATPEPLNQAALDYISERNAKRDPISDIPLHRLWQPTDAGRLIFVGFRLVNGQNLLLVRSGPEILALPITQQQRPRWLASRARLP